MNDKLVMFHNRLLKVYKHKSKQAARQNITCYRVYDHDLPEFPFCIELYDDKVYLAEYLRRHGMTDEEHSDWLEECVAEICSILPVSDENVYIKQRKRKANRLDQYEKTDAKAEYFAVAEQGLKFLVNLTDYLDTGLFLDHRITRLMVRNECEGKRVLNLIAYTGSFSVYAAAVVPPDPAPPRRTGNRSRRRRCRRRRAAECRGGIADLAGTHEVLR